MKNFKNRILSGAMAGVLAMSLAVPTLAGDSQPANSTVLEATYAEPTIEVNVTKTGNVTINPYGMPVELNPDATNPSSIVGAQIVTSPLAVVNTGTTNLNVSATVTAEAKGDLRLATSKPSSSDTTKSAYVYLQMTNSELGNSSKNVVDGKNIAGVAIDDLAGAVAAWEQRAYVSSTDLLLSGTAAASKNNMLVLRGSEANGDYNVGSIGLYRLAGQVVTNPREPWATADGFTATVAFTFTPDFTSASLDKTTMEVANGGTGDLTVTLTGATITKVEWTSDDDTVATVAPASTPDDGSKATVTNKLSSGASAASATITATVTASNGLVYELTCNVDCKG